MIELPQYRCHKVVRAAKIVGVENIDELTVRLHFNITKGQPLGQSVEVGSGWASGLARDKTPTGLVGGYYVVYGDCYTSFSPAAAFEAGYTLEPTDWVGRLVAEKAQLDERRTKLQAFVGSTACGCLPKLEQRDLSLQLDCMNDLADILGRRLSLLRGKA